MATRGPMTDDSSRGGTSSAEGAHQRRDATGGAKRGSGDRSGGGSSKPGSVLRRELRPVIADAVHPLDRIKPLTANPDHVPGLRHAFCVVRVNAATIGDGLVATGVALVLHDAETKREIRSWLWPVMQTHPPATIATQHGVTMRTVLEAIAIHERDCGYYFVDRSDQTIPLADVRAAVANIQRECGLGCYAAAGDVRAVGCLFGRAEPMPPDARPVQRSQDILADARDTAQSLCQWMWRAGR
jgi:hypothetical protein